MFTPAYVGVALIGLLHGLEPGHGWPVAVLYSLGKKNTVASAALSAGVIGVAHLVSSIAVVVAYVLLQDWLDFDAPWIKYLAAGILILLAIKPFKERPDGLEKQHGHIHGDEPETEHDHEHEHPGQGKHAHLHRHMTGVALSLLGLAPFALILGFAYEEEFALLALVAGGVNAWALMLIYGTCVLLGLMAPTILGVKIHKQLRPKLIRHERYVPKIGAALLAVMAMVIVLW